VPSDQAKFALRIVNKVLADDPAQARASVARFAERILAHIVPLVEISEGRKPQVVATAAVVTALQIVRSTSLADAIAAVTKHVEVSDRTLRER